MTAPHDDRDEGYPDPRDDWLEHERRHDRELLDEQMELHRRGQT
jgi:hypothetical protein